MIDFKFLSREEFFPLFNKLRPQLFKDNHDIDIFRFLSEEDKDKIAKLEKLSSNQYGLYLTAWDGEQLIGWSWGFQKNAIEFYMCNSAVIPEYRRQGIYTKLIEQIVKRAQDDGFQEITSKHHADNNAVIIPKLKLDFVIQGFEVNPRFGVLVNLVCYKNSSILNVHHQRTGYRKF
jgi:ribosomal protein S18 acetylase RimI-like enzyme